MSRFKFRVWSKNEKRIHDSREVLIDQKGNPWVEGNVSIMRQHICNAGPDSLIVMQATGLADENGQQIFEGD